MRVAALIVTECIGVMPAKDFEFLAPIDQMDFGDAARARFPIGDHGLPVRMKVVMGVCPT